MAAYTWNVTNANGHDGDMVLRQYSSFNLSSGNTLQPNNDCRGVMIFVDGDATIDGTITVHGAYGGTPADMTWDLGVIESGQTGSFTNSITNWGTGSTDGNTNLAILETIMNTKFPVFTSAGRTISTHSNSGGDATGGTGWGGGATNEGQNSNNQGSPFSGGAGNAGDIDSTPSAATRYGGQGGDGRGGAYAMGRGAGNPDGTGNNSAGDNTGGLFFLMASGDINGSGTIDCSGSNGGYAAFTSTEVLYSYGGGGSGGGRIILIARGSISSSITCNVNGGSGGGRASSKYLNSSAYNGQRGNHGTVTKVSGVG
jgi:hypothetical protein